MYQDEISAILATVNLYFDGIYVGDVEKLRRTFVETAHIYGDIRGEAYAKSLEEYLASVKTRDSPAMLNEAFEMEVLGIEVLGHVAMAQVHVPIFRYNYYDFLSLNKMKGTWKIVNKVFSHVE